MPDRSQRLSFFVCISKKIKAKSGTADCKSWLLLNYKQRQAGQVPLVLIYQNNSITILGKIPMTIMAMEVTIATIE